jgi:hypothetical protein
MNIKLQYRFFFTLVCFFSFQILVIGQEFEREMRKAYTLLTIVQERDRLAAERLDDVKSKRIQIEEDLVDAQDNPKALSKKEKEKLQKDLKSIKSIEKDALSKRMKAADFLTQVTDIIKAPSKKRSKFLADYEKDFGTLTDNTPNTTEENPTTDKVMPTESTITNESTVDESPRTEVVDNKPIKEDKRRNRTQGKPSEGQAQLRKYDMKNDVAYNPPVPECKVFFEGVDNFTGKRRKEMAPQYLIRHTEDFMKASFKDKDYITCEVSASRVQGGYYYLNMTFTIQTKESQRTFGFLDKGTPFVFRLINGSTVTLMNAKTDIGSIDPVKNFTTYRAQIQMTNADAKALMSSELDVLRVAWSAGYEDYDIIEMDMLKNLLTCLDKETK